MKIEIQGTTMPLKNLESARLRDIEELQTQTGWELDEIRTRIQKGGPVTTGILVFFSTAAAGVSMTWDEVLDLSFNDIKVITEPGDTARRKRGKADPQKPSGDSSPDDAAQVEAAPTEG